MTDVKIAYAKAHLPELVERASRGERITISRYNRAMAELGPARQVQRPKPKFGTLKGKVALIDPRALDPLTNEEVDAFIQGRY